MVTSTPIDLSRCKIKPYAHQVVGVQKLVDNPFFLLADEMGAGKTKQAIDAAQVLFTRNVIERVMVLTPAAVRAVWFDPELGELRKHLWDGIDAEITEYHAKTRKWISGQKSVMPLQWVITNYEFIRSAARFHQLLNWVNYKTLLICDESSAIKNHRAKQTKATLQLRRRCGRVLLLNGTPIANNPLDMYSQGNIMNPAILNVPSFIHFRSKYAMMGGFQGKVIIGWQNLEDLQRRFAPYVIRRLKSECLDLPPKLPSVTLTVPLSDETWAIYKDMRDEMIAWLDEQTVSVAPQAIVKAVRLSQLTSGFLGGLQEQDVEEAYSDDDRPPWVPPRASRVEQAVQTDIRGQETNSLIGNPCPPTKLPLEVDQQKSLTNLREVGREKLDLFLGWLDERLAEDPDLKLLVWCRFRAEVARLAKELQTTKPEIQVGVIWGGQKLEEREASKRLLDPRTMPKGPVVVIGTPKTGSLGLNLSGAHTVIWLSKDYSLFTRKQADDRVHRPGQTYPVSYFDVIATGPAGQKTIDHIITKAVFNKDEVATWTTKAWLTALREE